MNKQDAEEYTQSLAQIMGGTWRQIQWAKQQGIPQALELSTEDWVQQRLGGYVRLSITERREAVQELIEDGESQRGAAQILGVDEGTVRNDINAENSAPDDLEPAQIPEPDDHNAENSAPTVIEEKTDKSYRALQRAWSHATDDARMYFIESIKGWKRL